MPRLDVRIGPTGPVIEVRLAIGSEDCGTWPRPAAPCPILFLLTDS